MPITKKMSKRKANVTAQLTLETRGQAKGYSFNNQLVTLIII